MRLFALGWFAFFLSFGTVRCLVAAEPEPLPGKMPPYPRVNASVTYEVDPHWPRSPSEMKWAAVPGVAVDAQDNVYVFVRAQPPCRVFSREGKLLRTWGSNQLHTAHHLKIDHQGNIWAADIGLHVVRKFTPTGELLQTIGTPGVPGTDETHLDQPTDMAVTRQGDVFVADGYGNNRIVHFDAQGKFVKAWGDLGAGPLQFSLPHAVILDSHERLYVADRNNVRVQVFDLGGNLLESWQNTIVPWGFWRTAGSMNRAGRIDDLELIWICGSSPLGWRDSDEVLGCPPNDQVFMAFTPERQLIEQWRVPLGNKTQSRPGELDWVHCLAIDSRGDIYAGDIMGERIQKFVRKEAAR